MIDPTCKMSRAEAHKLLDELLDHLKKAQAGDETATSRHTQLVEDFAELLGLSYGHAVRSSIKLDATPPSRIAEMAREVNSKSLDRAFPSYVSLGLGDGSRLGCMSSLDQDRPGWVRYYCYKGGWGVYVRWDGDRLITAPNEDHPQLSEREVFPITRERWHKGNGRWAQ